jgi:hypothetical protein
MIVLATIWSFADVFLIVMNNSQHPLNLAHYMNVSEQNKNMEENGMLDLVTIVIAAVVCALPIIFMGYVKLMVQRVEKHTAWYKNGAKR